MASKNDIAVAAKPLIVRPVRVVVVYKPTNEAAMNDVPLKDCRKFFEAAVTSMRKKIAQEAQAVDGKFSENQVLDSDFLAIQIDWQDKTVITSTL